jgi:hypothetical protein
MRIPGRFILSGFLRREDGGALAELAIVVPFLIVMLAAVSEFGRYFQTYTTLAKATRSSSRYLSNHKKDATGELTRAVNLVVCGKLACGVGDTPLVPGLDATNVCLESDATSVTVKIPRTSGDCNPTAGANGANPYTYQPIFDIGALLGTDFTMALPIAPRTTMYYIAN